MNAPTKGADGAGNSSAAQSVAQQIIDTFLTALAAKPGYEEVAAKLTDEIVKKGNSSEAAIRGALFGDGAP